MIARTCAALVVATALVSTSARALEVEALWRVSVASDGSQARDSRTESVFGLSAPRISSDGTRVAFVSDSDNLVANDTNRAPDAFVHILATGQTVRVSVASDGSEAATGPTFFGFEIAAVSNNGEVAFVSRSGNLVPGDTNGSTDVFVHNLSTRSTQRISVNSSGLEALSHRDNRGAVANVRITPDGRYVAYESLFSDLVPDDSNNVKDIFVHDRVTRETSLITIYDGVRQGGVFPHITPDGRFVSFESPPTGTQKDVYVKDRATGDLWLENLSNDGAFLEAGDFQMGAPSISDDGRFVVFHTDAPNLSPGGQREKVVALRDRWLHTTTPILKDAYRATISGDGRFVTALLEFCVPRQLVLHDRITADTIRVSVAPDGRFGDGEVIDAAELSRDGRLVVFKSRASNLVDGDTNSIADMFVARIGDGKGHRGSYSDPTTDTDRDGTADECDGDDDGDAMPDEFEGRYGLKPLDRADADGDSDQDGMTNLAEFRARSNPTLADTDADGTIDGVDNCVILANSDQANFEGDAQGDACDADDDNDNVSDLNDPEPRGGSAALSPPASAPAASAPQPAATPTAADASASSGGGGAIGSLHFLLLLALWLARHLTRSRSGASRT